jgi:diaminohydroxyphosphoribosylaminopyrimidine deaminase/5-amino-6-(5-phosphoribosylamino)uracil reductase
MVDVAFMQRALFWAERGRGGTSPNPMVGAVVVSPDGVVVGQGAHLAAGGPHAEVHALAAAGARATGATLYCTLEPCCHVGRTGPCVNQIVAAGVARVVAAIQDPNPRVAGDGFAYLRRHGVAVEAGICAADAARQNEAYLTWRAHRRPFVIVKTAVSADGFAGRSDRRERLTGAEADRWFHRQRAAVDAIAVGAETVLVDDPLLTAREVFRARPLARVLFDWRLRIPPAARVFSTLPAGPVIMIVSEEAARDRPRDVAAFTGNGVIVETVADRNLTEVLARLADRGILSLLVEGGPTLQNAFGRAGQVDRIQRVMTPRRLGGGVAAPELAGLAAQETGRLQLGEDTLTEFDVHRTD